MPLPTEGCAHGLLFYGTAKSPACGVGPLQRAGGGSHQAVGIGQAGEDPDLIVVLKLDASRHCMMLQQVPKQTAIPFPQTSREVLGPAPLNVI